MMSKPERVRIKVAKSGPSLLLVLTKPLRRMGIGAGELVEVTFDEESTTIRRAS